MLKSQNERIGEDVHNNMDEGWWAAVLADEETFQNPRKTNNSKPISQPEPPTVDWDYIKKTYEQDEIIRLIVHGYNRGGLLVQGDGVQGFVPVSHLIEMPTNVEEDERKEILANYVGRTLCLKVIECEQDQERIVLSERAATAGQGRRKQLFETLATGSVMTGTVTNVTEFGVFVDLGGVEGLVHVSEISWGRVSHPAEILQIGQRVQTLVLQVTEESSRVALSIKRLQPNPWEVLAKRYKPGDIVAGKVTSIMRYGVFARLEEGVEGLIHISSVNFPGDIRTLEDLLFIGQPIQVRILHVDVERRRLGLGLVTVE